MELLSVAIYFLCIYDMLISTSPIMDTHIEVLNHRRMHEAVFILLFMFNHFFSLRYQSNFEFLEHRYYLLTIQLGRYVIKYLHLFNI